MKIGLLVSGRLGQSVLTKIIDRIMPEFIATDSGSHEIISQANKFSIPVFVGNPRSGKLFDFCRNYNAQIILSINYLFLIEDDLINHFNCIVNFHGSLLPKYRGRTPHIWAIINNENVTGITAHMVDSGCDTGDILYQLPIPIDSTVTGGEILLKFQDVYPDLIFKVLQLFETNEMRRKPQDHTKATYFGKRTPEDGHINWAWQKERIRNWVRAQADPYPGAFTFIDGERIIIDQIEFSDLGFNYNDPNGLIIRVDKETAFVKTPNGVIELKKIRDNKHVSRLIVGKILK